MAATVEHFQLQFENGINIKLLWKNNDDPYVTICEMDEQGNIGTIIDHFATICTVFYAERVSGAVNAMKG